MPAQDFLTATLGADGFQALDKAAARVPALQSVFVPRTIIAWLDCASRLGFEGQVPGTQAVVVKNELVIGGEAHALSDAGRAAAALIIELVDDIAIPENLEARAVARLAKSIDILVKARFVRMVKTLEASATDDAVDLGKSIEDMTKGQGYKSTDGLVIPKGQGADRQAWDKKYTQALADRFADGDVSKLVPVQVPVTDHAFGHYVGSNPDLQPRYRVPMYQKMLAAGDQLPPVFAEQGGNNVFKVIDGNARLKAALADGKTTHLSGYTLKKGIEEPGQAAKARGPSGPEAPQLATKAPATGKGIAQPAPLVSRARGFYKSELSVSCKRCGESQMRGRQVVGCLCIAEVVMSAELTQKSEGDRIILSGPDAVIVVIENRLGMTPA